MGKVQVDASTRYEDALAVQSDLKTETQAGVRGAQVVAERVEWTDDPVANRKVPRAIVTLRIPLGGPGGGERVLEGPP